MIYATVANEKSGATGILSPMRADSVSGEVNLVRIVTTDQLLLRGLTAERIKTLVRRGALIRLARGCYVAAKAAEPFLRRPEGRHVLAAGAALAGSGPDLVASHVTAARIHGLDLLRRPEDVVTLTRARDSGSRRSAQGARLTSAGLPAGHVTLRYGLRVTTPARTVVDLARALPFRAGVVTADSALRAKQTSKKELRAVVAECRSWPGIARAREVVEFADRLSESALESIARVVIRDLGLPPPTLQAQVGGEEPIGRADFLWEQFNTIGEADGALKYADPDRARQQLRRDARLREAGFEVVHFGWREITERPERVGASILAAFERGRYAASPPLPTLRPARPAGPVRPTRPIGPARPIGPIGPISRQDRLPESRSGTRGGLRGA
jgi:very-short-patch-repair endonuclease/predicted transcriptional regulator of viral defense system